MIERIRAFLRRRTRPEETELSRQAGVWVQDETLNVVLATLRDSTIENWAKSRDPETRERAWLMLRAIDGFAEALLALHDNEKVRQMMDQRAERREQGGSVG